MEKKIAYLLGLSCITFSFSASAQRQVAYHKSTTMVKTQNHGNTVLHKGQNGTTVAHNGPNGATVARAGASGTTVAHSGPNGSGVAHTNYRTGHYVHTVPRGGAVIVHGSVSYHCVAGVYYRPYGAGFTVCAPPFGLRITILPIGYTRVVIAGLPYFMFQGIYYQQLATASYVVVQNPTVVVAEVKPAGEVIILHTLPPENVTVKINGSTFYRVNDTYYEKFTSENGTINYRLAGQVR